MRLIWWWAIAASAMASEPASQFLSYSTCGGLTNQRIAFIQGMIVAKAAQRSPILPAFHSSYTDDASTGVDMEFFYDKQATLPRISSVIGQQITDRNALLSTDKPIKMTKHQHRGPAPNMRGWWQALNVPKYKNFGIVDVGCGLFSVNLRLATADHTSSELFWTINDAIRPSAKIASAAQQILTYLKNLNTTTVALHVRAESDWVAHCEAWENIKDGIIRDNCMTNTDNLLNTLSIAGIEPGATIYLAGGYTKQDITTNPHLNKLTRSFNVITKEDIITGYNADVLQAQREYFAAIDFEVCLKVPIFVGNSVSTFSAMLLMMRERQRQLHDQPLKHFHYNGAEIPLLEFIPLDVPYDAASAWPLKWVFAYTSGHEDYDAMVRVAVESALRNTKLRPVCVFHGQPNHMLAWLKQRGVYVIQHTPEWEGKMYAAHELMKKNLRWSPLYAAPDRMIATFLRIDIPLLGIADDYVLYTDVDVVFVSDIDRKIFGKPPEYFTLGVEASGDEDALDGLPFGNAGVMLMNLKNLRRTYNEFKQYIFSDENMARGLHFGKFGPGDQGAYNSFYSGKFKVIKWPLFNWKPYWPVVENARILHFHGAKPADYRRLRKSGTTHSSVYDGLLASCKMDDPNNRCHKALKLYEEIEARIQNTPSARSVQLRSYKDGEGAESRNALAIFLLPMLLWTLFSIALFFLWNTKSGLVMSCTALAIVLCLLMGLLGFMWSS